MGRYALADNKDRLFSALVYLFALKDVVFFGAILSSVLPAIAPIMNILSILLLPATIIYGIVGTAIPGGFGSLIIFFILIVAVVQNQNISYFIRFNTMQSILIGIASSLIQIIITAIPLPSLIINTVGGVAFIIAMPVCLYCMVQCALGKYPEIPSFSKFVYNQVR